LRLFIDREGFMNQFRTSFVEELESDYASTFGVVAGYLPADRNAVDEWQRALMDEVAATSRLDGSYERSVQALESLIDSNGIVRMYVTEMIDQVPEQYKTIHTTDQLLAALNHIIKRAPSYDADPAKRNFFPFYALFLYMMYTKAGDSAFRSEPFNESLRGILKQWCEYLDSGESRNVLHTGPHGWLSPSARLYCSLDEFDVPDRNAAHWGFKSFNDFFHRQVKADCRPIAEPDNPRIIVSPNDGAVYRLARDVGKSERFWLKGQPYSLADMMADSPFVERFVGGDVLQTFLAAKDYHRWTAPIAGVVRGARTVPGLMFSQLRSLGFHPNDSSMLPQAYDSCVNTRGLVFIESDAPPLGMICVIPVGITEVSSVSIAVEVGQRVRKGEELGYFSYGGSSLCLVFEKGTVERFTIDPPLSPDGGSSVSARVTVNASIAVARDPRGG
jgi:phosphatidylserine decarboxylase